MFSCCRANPKASKKDKDKQHQKSNEGNDDDEGCANVTNEINESVAAAAAADAEAEPKPTYESETEKETDAKPNGNLSSKPTTEFPQSAIENENEERSENHIDQTGIQNILKYILTYIFYTTLYIV